METIATNHKDFTARWTSAAELNREGEECDMPALETGLVEILDTKGHMVAAEWAADVLAATKWVEAYDFEESEEPEDFDPFDQDPGNHYFL